MLRTMFFAALVFMVSACAVSTAQQDAQIVGWQHQPDEATPQCFHPRQCEAMWVAARDWFTHSCRAKIRADTENFLATIDPTDGSVGLACQVIKWTQPEPGYMATYTFYAVAGCASISSCAIKPMDALRRLNDNLKGVAAQITD
jgi:hypothetical protein